MKKQLITIVSIFVLFLFPVALSAGSPSSDGSDKIHLGVKGGLNLSNVYDTDNEDFRADPKLGFAAGAFVSIPLGSFLGIQPEFLFSQRGYRGSGTVLFNDYSYVRTANFVDVPILLAIKPTSMVTILVGPQYSYLVSERYVFTSDAINLDIQDEYENDDVRRNTMCITGGVDININNIVIGARAGWDLLDNHVDGTTTTPRYKNMWTQLTLGLRF